MRVSILKDDKDYISVKHAASYTVYLDGKPVDWCLTADEEEGYVIILEVQDGKASGRQLLKLGKVEIHKHEDS